MKKKTRQKFKEKMQSGMTYEQYFQARFRNTVGLAKAFERALGRKKAFEIVKKWAEESSVESVKNLKPIKKFEDFKLLFKEQVQNKSPFWMHVLTISNLEETLVKLSCHITECLWAETFKKMNAPELGYILCCHPDFAMARAYNPKIRLKRTKTLMQGDSYCNHTYYWNE